MRIPRPTPVIPPTRANAACGNTSLITASSMTLMTFTPKIAAPTSKSAYIKFGVKGTSAVVVVHSATPIAKVTLRDRAIGPILFAREVVEARARAFVAIAAAHRRIERGSQQVFLVFFPGDVELLQVRCFLG